MITTRGTMTKKRKNGNMKGIRNPMFIRKSTSIIQDKREKATLRRHKHELFQAKLLRKEIQNDKENSS